MKNKSNKRAADRRNRKERPAPSGKAAGKAVGAEGVGTEALGYENYRVELDNGVTILASPSGRMRLYRIRIAVGDRVAVELSPYDLTRGRISRRFDKPREQ